MKMGQNINEIQRELAQLREENARLKELLRKHGIADEASTSPIVPTQKLIQQLSLEEKVVLFWSIVLPVFRQGVKLK